MDRSFIVEVQATATAFVEVVARDAAEAAALAPQAATEGERLKWSWGSLSVVEHYEGTTATPLAFEAWQRCEARDMYGTPWCRVHDAPLRDRELCYRFGEAEADAGLPTPARMDGTRPCFCFRGLGPVIHTRYCDNVVEQYPQAAVA